MWHPPLYITFSVRLYIRGAPYIRNHILCDHNFWYTFVKWWYFQVYYFISFNPDFLSIKGQKIAQNEWKIKICHVPYLRNDHDFWCSYVKRWYLQVFIFLFFQFWFFGLLVGNRAKNSPKWQKNLSRSNLRKHTSYDCHLW